MKNAKDFKRPFLGIVNDEIGTHRSEAHGKIGQILAGVSLARHFREASKGLCQRGQEIPSGGNAVLGYVVPNATHILSSRGRRA